MTGGDNRGGITGGDKLFTLLTMYQKRLGHKVFSLSGALRELLVVVVYAKERVTAFVM